MDYLKDGRSKLLRNICNKLSIDIACIPEDLIFILLHVAETAVSKTSKPHPQSNFYRHNFLFSFDLILSHLILILISSFFNNFLFPFDPIPSYPILSYPHSHQFAYLQNQISWQSYLLTSPNFVVPTCN